VGESGARPVAAVIASAVEDAVADTGVSVYHMPLTPRSLIAPLRLTTSAPGN
jgi:CO/xanthine dehydrogenase Mo-binding subunit